MRGKGLGMPRVDLTLGIDIERTPRVQQVEGIFDVPAAKRQTVDFHFNAEFEERDWQIGLIVGPSGAGKSSVARSIFGDAIVESYEWPAHKSLVDGFAPDLDIQTIVGALSSVGFSSPPGWMKPFAVLSNGEKFRATLARAILDERALIVVDEFTSVVDRSVARVGSHAVAKAVRKIPGKKFVGVSCHDDIVDWLQPDWILEPHVGAFTWRCLRRRPEVQLEVVRCSHEAWRWFAAHHYLTASLHRAARCFVGLVDGRPVAFAGILHMPHPKRKNLVSLSRVVVLPDFQGLGLGAYSFTETIARIAAANGKVLCTHPAHPALVRAWAKSPLWKMTHRPDFQRKPGHGSTIKTLLQQHAKHRRVAHFQWCGGNIGLQDREAAISMWQCGANAKTKSV